MAVVRVTQFAIVTLHILLGIVVALANREFCGGVFLEMKFDHALIGHVMLTVFAVDEFDCHFKCISKSCMSFNVHPSDSDGNRVCELNNKTRQMKPSDFKQKRGSTYYGPVQVSCTDLSNKRNAGRGLYKDLPGHSCKDIRDSGFFQKDGEYWIDPEKNGKPLKVYCDMTTDGGGWLLVSNVVVDDPSSRELWTESSYREIDNCHSNKTLFITKDAMKELRAHVSFTQLRFHCSKQRGRTIHVTTVANSCGEVVVQYFSGQTDVQPLACGSFHRMKDDNSRLAGMCDQWKSSRWGSSKVPLERLNDHSLHVGGKYHWSLTDESPRWECDDFKKSGEEFFELSSGDFWKVYVR